MSRRNTCAFIQVINCFVLSECTNLPQGMLNTKVIIPWHEVSWITTTTVDGYQGISILSEGSPEEVRPLPLSLLFAKINHVFAPPILISFYFMGFWMESKPKDSFASFGGSRWNGSTMMMMNLRLSPTTSSRRPAIIA